MALAPPTLDPRDAAAVLRQAEALRPFYTPEWQGVGEGDPGRALLEIFARLLEGSIERLNRAPAKAFLAFLDLIGVELLPARPARVPLSFRLSTGAARPVTVPAGSQAAAAPAGGGEPLVFETESAFVATPAALVAVVSVDPERDTVLDHLPALAAGATAALWDTGAGPDLQEHALYLGHEDLLNLEGPARIAVTRTPPDPRLASGAVAWEYLGEGEEERDGQAETVPAWRPLRPGADETGGLVLEKPEAGALPVAEIGGVESRWIRARAVPGRIAELASVELRELLLSVSPAEAGGSPPDAAFANDVELGPEQPFLPFGPRPRTFDAFYLASAEAFSKRGAQVTLRVVLSEPERDPFVPDSDLTLAWEYWDGRGWSAIPDLEDGTARLSTGGEIVFLCPEDLEPVAVVGREGHWIRVRIVAGDYGRERFGFSEGQVTVQADFHPPRVASLGIDYDPEPAPLQAVLARNNRAFEDRTGAARPPGPGEARAGFRPFVPLEADDQALYLGFDRVLERGPLSLFFVVEEQEVAERSRPRVEWQYLRRRSPGAPEEWARLEVDDASAALTETGTVSFIAPPDMARSSRFGLAGWWLRAVDAGSRFRSPERRLEGALAGRPDLAPASPRPLPGELDGAFFGRFAGGGAAGAAGRLPCARRDPRAAALRDLPHPSLVVRELRGLPAAPRLRGLFPNTTWAVQSETVDDEILGSSTGLADQRYFLARPPVSGEEIWVDELLALSDGERAALVGNASVEEERDPGSAVTGFWVRWRPVADLDAAGAEDRVYAVDRTFGEIRFGDGANGRVPPIGRDNLRARYRSGGGAAGNVPAGAVSSLRTTVPLVDAVTNPVAAGGGADTEPLERAVERGPQGIAHRGRAVTRSDYEWLAREASQAVARVRCLPRFDDEGKERSNWVTVIVAPESALARPTPSPELRRQVELHLARRAAAVTAYPAHVRVIGPAYVEVRVRAELYPVSIDLAPAAELAAAEALRAFLHPLTGGPRGRGWEFGRLPCPSDLFALLEAIDGVDHVGELTMTLQPVGPEGEAAGEPLEVTPDGPEDLALPEYALVASGEHAITSRLPD